MIHRAQQSLSDRQHPITYHPPLIRPAGTFSPSPGRREIRGFILFITMSMLLILSLLVLSLMQLVSLSMRASNHLLKQHQTFYQLEAVAQQLQASFASLDWEACLVSESDPNRVIALLRTKQGCVKQSFLVAISDLGDHPCLQIKSEGLLKSSHHWLLTIATGDRPFETLQLRIARPVSLMACDGDHRMIHRGVISWRHLI